MSFHRHLAGFIPECAVFVADFDHVGKAILEITALFDDRAPRRPDGRGCAAPLHDIAKGSQAEKYVGYAYSRGYTNGYSATQFKPAGAVNAYQYTEFCS